MQQGEASQRDAADAPDVILPALGNAGNGILEEYEEFYSQDWERLGPVDREIR
jgi:hypothetical protein